MSFSPFSRSVREAMVATDAYICSSFIPKDAALEAALDANSAAGLDSIDVAPNQGKLLYLLAKMNNAKRILEVGTLGGYSAIWLAKALPPDGKLITLELEPEHARVAQKNIDRAGFSSLVEIKVGPALRSLENMGNEGKVEPFDFVFIDADKINNTGYLSWALKFSRVGTVVVIDNVGRKGQIADPESENESVQGTRAVFEMIKNRKKIDFTAVQTVGSKGWDGFAMGLVVE